MAYVASRSSHKTFSPAVRYVQYARSFCFSDDLYQIASTEGGARLLFAEVDFGYGDLTAVYGRDGKKLRGFAYRNHIMVEHSQPDGLVSRYEYDHYDTDGKVLKSSTNF